MIIVPASSANALRVVRGGSEDKSPGRRIHPVAFELEHGVASQHEEELLVCGRIALIVLIDESPAARAVHAVAPNDVMPKWCGTGR